MYYFSGRIFYAVTQPWEVRDEQRKHSLLSTRVYKREVLDPLLSLQKIKTISNFSNENFGLELRIWVFLDRMHKCRIKWVFWNADFWENNWVIFIKTDGTIPYWLDPVLRAIPGQNEEKSREIIVCKKNHWKIVTASKD